MLQELPFWQLPCQHVVSSFDGDHCIQYGYVIRMENRIRAVRKAKGLSQEQLGEMVGTNKVQIGRLEKGNRRLTIDWVEKIAKALDCHPMELLGEAIPATTEREKAILQLYRDLSPDQQQAFLQLASTIPKPTADSDGNNEPRPKRAA